jgi:hypothetical protein
MYACGKNTAHAVYIASAIGIYPFATFHQARIGATAIAATSLYPLKLGRLGMEKGDD